MRDGLRTEVGRRRLLARDDEPPANEDFLFHLSRGSELLLQNRVVEAKEALERALENQPRDAESQDLLAGVYFRLGVYPTAIRIWESLARDFPDDSVLHVNLGLCLFKTGQPDEARAHLERALELDPSHERAWGYLGLVLWRLGHLDAAREAFLRGGQESMARRMAEQSSAGATLAPESPNTLAPPPPIEDADVTAMRDAAGAAALRVGRSTDSLSLEVPTARRPTGSWSVVETGADPLPRQRRISSPSLALSNPRLGAVAASWAVDLPEDTPLAVGPEGELLLRTRAAVHARASGLRAMRGGEEVEGATRRFRGRDAVEALGGEADPILRWHGPLAAVAMPPAGDRFHALRVDGSLLYVREELVHAFDDRVGYESARLPLAGESVQMLSFHGEGDVVLRLPRRPSGLEVRPDEDVRVDPRALVGWTGRLFPREVALRGLATLPLSFKGEGILLVT